MITDMFGQMIKSAIVEDAALREAFIIDSVRPLVEERDGKIYLKADIALRVKSNQDAVDQYKEKVREAIAHTLSGSEHLNPYCGQQDHEGDRIVCTACQMKEELGL